MKRNEEPCPEAEERGTRHEPHQKRFKVILPKFLSGSEKTRSKTQRALKSQPSASSSAVPLASSFYFLAKMYRTGITRVLA